MSDTLDSSPANAENNASVEATEADAKVVDTEGAESATAAAEAGKPAHRDRTQERFDQLTREKYEGLSRAERAEYRAQLLEQQIAELKESAKTPAVAPQPKPTLESCGWDEGEFERQLLAYNSHRSADSSKSVSEAVKAQLAAEREAESLTRAEEAWKRKEADFIKSKPDYTEKVLEGVRRGSWFCSKEMSQAISLSDNGPEIGYYLAENPEKSLAIGRMPSDLQKLEIGRIAGRLEALKAAPPPVSKAPPPVSKIDAGTSVDDSTPNPTWSDERFEKWRARQIAQRG